MSNIREDCFRKVLVAFVEKTSHLVPGGDFHITSRGNRRTSIFYDDEDRLMYLEYLEETRMHFPFSLHAYCLMTNHIHLLLETKDHPTAAIMKHMHAKYATYFNRRHELSGHLFQGRYGGGLIKDDAHFLQVSRYIHLNPVKAGLVSHPHHYPWSSCRALVTSTPDSHISLTRTLALFPSPPSFHYQHYLEENIQGGSFHDSINE